MNHLVKPEHQYQGVDAPLDPVRMAWPFKTKEELEVLRKWFKRHEQKEKKRRADKLLEAERAFL